MDGDDRSALASIFAVALNLADEVAPAAQPGIDGATAGVIGQSTRVLRRELEAGLNQVPSIVGIPPTVLEHLAALARIVRGTRTECVAFGDVAIYLARSDMRSIAANGWQELSRTRPENQGLMAWANEENFTLSAETIAVKTHALADTDADTNRPGEAATTKPKRRGRKKADYETEQRESELAAAWRRARESGMYKADFAHDHGMKLTELNSLLTRVRKRNARADK